MVHHIVISFLVLMAISAVAGYLLFIRKFLQLEDLWEIAKEESVERSLTAEKEHLANTCQDWAIWNESWRFLRDENPEFIESNLSLETVVGLNLNLMSFVRNDGSIKWQMEVDLEEGVGNFSAEFPPDSFPEDFASSVAEDLPTGLMTAGKRIFVMVSHPIVNGSGPGEPSGTLYLGRELTPPVIDRLSKMTNVDFQVDRLEDLEELLSPERISRLKEKGRYTEKNKDRITNYRIIGNNGEESSRIVMTIVQDRVLMKLGWEAFLLYLAIALSGVLAVAASVLRFMHHRYLTPVKVLYQNVVHIKEQGDLSFRIPVRSNDEFGRLCEGFNNLLEVIQEQTHELNKRNLDLHEQVNTDELTGLFNKRFYRNWLESRESGPLADGERKGSFIMVDLDHFKLYNDRYGHIAGDLCLRSVAKILMKSVTRDKDFPCRYGGEEFLIILENTLLPGAESVARKILDGIEELEIDHADSPTSSYLTASIGISCGVFSSSPEELERLVKIADEALYESKTNGRNRYTVGKGP